MAQIGVVFRTTKIDPVTQAFLVEAWDRQSEEFCAAWDISYVPVVLYSDIPQDEVASGEIRIMTVQDTMDVPGAEGYHTDELGLIFARILSDNDADSGSHECCEENADPDCSQYVPIPNTSNELALEVSDPVQALNYLQDATVGDETRQVPVSDFVYPSYFDPNGQPPFDKMEKLTAPFTMAPGGYQIILDASGGTEDVFAKVVYTADERGRMAAEKRMARPDSRLSRRLATGHPLAAAAAVEPTEPPPAAKHHPAFG